MVSSKLMTHHDFVGRDDLHELRIALDLDDFQLQLQDVFPGVAEFVEEQARDARDEPQFDFRQRPPGQRPALAAAAQQAVDDRIEDRRVDVEDQVAFQRLGLQQIEASGILQAEDELAVGELIDAGELHFDDRCAAGPDRAAPKLRPKPSCSVCKARICSLPTRSGRLKS